MHRIQTIPNEGTALLCRVQTEGKDQRASSVDAAKEDEITMASEEKGEETATPPMSIWERIERPERPTHGPAPTLTYEQITSTAITIADATGLEAVSMRRLAEQLGVSGMALYRYVTVKDDLLGLMLNAVYAEVDVTEIDRRGRSGWRDAARSLADQLRAMHLRHPWASQIQGITAAGFSPNALAVNEAAFAALDGLGLDVGTMVAAFATIMAFVEGMVAEQVAMRLYLNRRGFKSEEDLAAAFPDAFAPYIRWIFGRADRYPNVLRLMTSGYREDYDQNFHFGLDCVLDGIAARLGI